MSDQIFSLGGLSDKTFVLGVGAQKSATTWVFEYLRGRPEVAMTPLKEIHFFDALWCPAMWDGIEPLKAMVGKLPPYAHLVEEAALSRIRTSVDRLGIISGGVAAYVHHFCTNLEPQHSHFGEITPSYSMLPVEGFQHIRSLHPDIRILFIMRDPIERFLSQARMRHRVRPGWKIEDHLRESRYVERTRYDKTVRNLRAVFPESNIFFGFYENLFCDQTIKEICDFLGLSFSPAAYDRRIGESDVASGVTDGDLIAAAKVFAPVYDFCRGEFGSALPASWRTRA